jgi:hypothetical protein
MNRTSGVPSGKKLRSASGPPSFADSDTSIRPNPLGKTNLNVLDMRDPNIFHPASRRSEVRLFLLVAAFFSGALKLPLLSETSEPKILLFPFLDRLEILRPKVFVYERSQRDPFVDASVKLTLLSQNNATTPQPEELGLNQFTQELHSELLQCHRITGVVSGESDGVVLIGRRILRTGDTLRLPLGEELLKKMQAAEQAQHLGLGDILGESVLPLEIVWISPEGIGLSHVLLEEALTLPFLKNSPTTSPVESTTLPK